MNSSEYLGIWAMSKGKDGIEFCRPPLEKETGKQRAK